MIEPFESYLHQLGRTPVAEDWSWLDSLAGQLDNDFVRAVNEQLGSQERPALDEFFR